MTSDGWDGLGTREKILTFPGCFGNDISDLCLGGVLP